LLDIVAKNTQQKSPAIAINIRTLIQPHVYYTCPVGKIAKVTGKVGCTFRGAATESRFNFAGIIMFAWVTAAKKTVVPAQDVGGEFGINEPRNMTTFGGGQYGRIDDTLMAGELISTSQNSGTNSEFNVFLEITELPV